MIIIIVEKHWLELIIKKQRVIMDTEAIK